VIYGVRAKRDDGLRRLIATVVLHVFLLLGFGVLSRDTKVPYRSIRTAWPRVTLRIPLRTTNLTPTSLPSNTSAKTTRFNGAGNAMRFDRNYAVLAIVHSKFHFFSCA
jgi:hypothetical protein